MPSDFSILPFVVCFAFVLFLVPLVLCLILWNQISTLSDRLKYVEKRLGDLYMEKLRASQALQPHAPAVVPATDPAAAPRPPVTVEPAPIAPPATMPAMLRQHMQERREQQSPIIAHDATPNVSPSSAPSALSPPPNPPAAAPRSLPVVASSAQPSPPRETRAKGWEAYIVTKGFVVIGAIILALTAIFLVKMGIDAGYFNAAVRDFSGMAAGVVLIGLGQWRRRHEGFWSQGATGAGIVAVFAAVFAATTLHHFLDPLTGFILLAVATASAVAMSLQNWSGSRGENKGGILIATLGLIGGFITPILVNSGHDNVPGLFGYLLLLHVGLIGSTRVRGWSVLAAVSVVFSSLWLIFWVLVKWDGNPGDGAYLGTFMLGMIVSLVVATVRQPEKWAAGRGGFAAMSLTWLAVGLGLLSSCLLLGRSNFDDLQWAFFAALTAGAFVLARVRPMYEGMAWLASFAVLAMLTAWGLASSPSDIELFPRTITHAHLQMWLIGFGLATTLGAYACLWKSAAPFRWAILSSILSVAYVGTAYWVLPAAPRPAEWAYLPLIGAGLVTLLTIPIYFRRATINTGEETLSAFSLAVLAHLTISAAMALSAAPLTAAWAALLPLTALVNWRLRIPGLVKGIVALYGMVALRGVMIHLIIDAGGDGRTLWWNPVVWTYGSILLALALSGWLMKQTLVQYPNLDGIKPSMFTAGSIAAGFFLLTLLIRWYYHDGQLDSLSLNFTERGTYSIAWLALAIAFLSAAYSYQQKIARYAGSAFAYLGIGFVIVICTVMMNPLATEESVGTMRIFNGLLYAYGVPAAACAVIAWLHWKRPESSARTLARIAAIAALLLVFNLVTLEVQHLFRGDHLQFGHGPMGEFTAYSLAWTGLGVIYLLVGIVTRSPLLRWASLIIMFITILKVFIFDMADLHDIERVLSFAGLGISLMALAFIYQRFVFRKPAPAP